jgi:hypothetical protein
VLLANVREVHRAPLRAAELGESLRKPALPGELRLW